MALAGGVGSWFGLKVESVYGTAVAVDQFVEINSALLKKITNTAQGRGLANGLMLPRGNRRVVTTTAAEGTIGFDVVTNSMGRLLNAITGGTVTPTPLTTGSTAYGATFPFTDTTGKSYTMQVGISDNAAVMRPQTFKGAKVIAATFSCGVDEILTAEMTVDARAHDDTVAAASPSYVTTSTPFHFGQMAVKLGTYGTESSVSDVRAVSVTIDRPHHTGRYHAGTGGLKGEPSLNDYATISGTVEVDLTTASKAAFVDRFTGNTSTSMVLEWVGTTAITGTSYPTFRITLPQVWFTDATPVLEGPDAITMSIPFESTYDGTNAPSIYTISSDTAL